jgi:hypothetical protein
MRKRARFGTPRLAACLGLVVIALVALASVGGFAKANGGPASAQYQYQVAICHKGDTIVISSAALPAHLNHGDTVGACP